MNGRRILAYSVTEKEEFDKKADTYVDASTCDILLNRKHYQ